MRRGVLGSVKSRQNIGGLQRIIQKRGTLQLLLPQPLLQSSRAGLKRRNIIVYWFRDLGIRWIKC